MTFTNSVACTPDNINTAERFRCGAASYLQFDTVAGTPNGSYIFGQTLGNVPTETTGGTAVFPAATTGTIRWTPRDTVATGGGTGLGIIGHNETGTMSFSYFVDPSVPSGTTINFATTAYWSDTSSFTTRAAQSALTANCSIVTSNVATWARVSSFAAREEDGHVVVEWETAAEVGTVAFEVERRDSATGGFARISETAVPAVQQLPGGRYRLVDSTAPRGGVQTYRVVEIDQQGGRETFGPYRVRVRPESGRATKAAGRDFMAQAKDLSPRLIRAAVATKSAATGSSKASVKASARARVEVSRTGMVRLRAVEIAAALGMSTDETSGQIRAGKLRLSRGGQDVAWKAADDGDGVVFYGEAIASPYTLVNVYWLERGAGLTAASTAVRAASGPGAGSFADTLHLETDAIPATSGTLPVEDYWIWKSFFPGYPGYDRATLTVQAPAPAAGPATLAVNLFGFTSSQRVSVRVNGQAAGEVTGGAGAFSGQVTLPAGLLRDGANDIEVVALEAARGVWLDSFDLSYPHAYRAVGNRLAFQAGAGAAVDLSGFGSADVAVWDLAQPLAPRRLTGIVAQLRTDGSWGVAFTAPDAGPFLALTGAALDAATVRASAPADLKNPGRGAEYVVISPSSLRAEAQRLADLRTAQGLSTMVADLGDVMDVFGDGIYDPRAIRSFLSWAVRSWPTPPRYVVLAGKGTYDPRNLLGLSTNLVPTLLVTTEDGIATADGEIANLDGSGAPAVALGRIPVVTAAELRAYVDKVAAYEREPGGVWTGSALLVSDDTDQGGNFAATNDVLAGALGSSLAISRVDLPSGASSAQVQDSRSGLFNALREGRSLVNYVGHGGLDRITVEGLLLSTDVPALGNGPRLPVMTALTCLISQFGYPSVSSLGEELVLEPNGGVAALFGPTWLSYNGAAEGLGRSLLPRLAATDGGRLGDRVVRALAEYAAQGGDPQMLKVYVLLGDPGLVSRR
ncbi:MAG: C25 family cysteine peptidase [Thermoanaerobaculia bacterium]